MLTERSKSPNENVLNNNSINHIINDETSEENENNENNALNEHQHNEQQSTNDLSDNIVSIDLSINKNDNQINDNQIDYQNKNKLKETSSSTLTKELSTTINQNNEIIILDDDSNSLMQTINLDDEIIQENLNVQVNLNNEENLNNQVILNNQENLNNQESLDNKNNQLNNQTVNKIVNETVNELDNEAGNEADDEDNNRTIELHDDDSETDSEQDSSRDIIDGMCILSFLTKEELNEFTKKDEKLRAKNNPKNDLKRTNYRKPTSSRSINLAATTSTSSINISSSKKKSSSSSTAKLNSDPVFVCSQLDDLLNKPRKGKFKDYLDDSSFDNLINSKQNKITSYTSYDSDSSLNSNQQRKSTSFKSINNYKSFTQSKSSKTKSFKKSSEVILTNEILSELTNSKELDDAYLKCKEQVIRAHDLIIEKMRTKFIPHYLFDVEARKALSTLHPNIINELPDNLKISSPSLNFSFDDNTVDNSANYITTHKTSTDKNNDLRLTIKRNNKEIISKTKQTPPTVQELNAQSLRPAVENTTIKKIVSKPIIKLEEKGPLFKIDPEEDFKPKIKVHSGQIELDKAILPNKKKAKTNYVEEGFDITRIISKHSKRDIRLPVRYHESGILVGSQWILPNFEENKNRVVNTGTGNKKISPKFNRVRKPTTNSKFDDNVNLSINSKNCQLLSPDDLMTEDEDNSTNDLSINKANDNLSNGLLDEALINELLIDQSTTNALINSSSTKVSKKLTKEEKIIIFRDLYRKLFYSNQPLRKDYYLKKGKKPSVNKLDVSKEAELVIEELTKQDKSYESAKNCLLKWKNSFKLCLKSIEQSNGIVNEELIKNTEKVLNQFRTIGTKKINLALTAVYESKMRVSAIPVDPNNPSLTTTSQQLQQKQQQVHLNNQINSSINKLANTPLISFNGSTIALNKQVATTSGNFTNCQPSNIAFLDNVNGISRVMNLKPKKHAIILPTTKPSTISNFKANGIRLSAPTSRTEKAKIIKNNYIVNATQQVPNRQFNSSLLLKKNLSSTNNLNNKGFMQYNSNVNFLTQPPGNSFLTLKITGNGLQMPYSPEVFPIANPQQPNQINHHLIANPQIVPNSIAQSNTQFVTTKFVPYNFIHKPNETITTSHHHPNLSITESLTSPSTSQTLQHPTTSQHPPPFRNYAKILPKFSTGLTASTNNMVKMTTPVPFLQNLHLIPTTHNLVISPINNISSTCHTATAVNSTFGPPKPTVSIVNITPKSSNSDSPLKFQINGEKSQTNSSAKVILPNVTISTVNSKD